MAISSEPDRAIGFGRIVLLFCLFVLIAFGLGYPILNRFDPRQTVGLSDVHIYGALVAAVPNTRAPHVSLRVLVPLVARGFYWLARGHIGSWDPVLFGLLAADSLFVAASALVMVILGTRKLHSYIVGLIAALLYLVNFAVPNLRLVGLVDAGEGFFLLALLWTLSEKHLLALPLIGLLGALTKESFIPFSMVFTAFWWLVQRKRLSSSATAAAWILAFWLTSFAAFAFVQWRVAGHVLTPIAFAASLHNGNDYLRHFAGSVSDRNSWYIFIWLLPLGIPKLRVFPKEWLIPIAATSITAFVLDGYYGGAPGTIGRALFSIAGPVLALSCALFVSGPAGQATPIRGQHPASAGSN